MNTLFHWGKPIFQQALLLGVFACLIFLPIVALVYYRQNSRLLGRWVWAAPLIIIYLVGIISFTTLPLPDPDTFRCSSTLYYPRYFAGWSLQFAYESTAGLGFTRFFSPLFAQIYLNVLLFVPFGIFARWIFKRSFRVTLFSAFATTLLIELSQLTGLWGYFSCRYRTFDVDDMITNTLGAVLGWIVAELATRRISRHKTLE